MKFKLFPIVFVCLIFAGSVIAQTVVEDEIALVLGERTSIVKLVVESSSRVEGRASVTFTSPAGERGAGTTKTYTLEAGRNTIDFEVPLEAHINDKDFPFYTLQYEIGNAKGSRSVARIAAQIFDIEMFQLETLERGARYKVRLRAVHPVYLRGVPGVRIAGQFAVGDSGGLTSMLPVSGLTDANGFADITVKVPAGVKPQDAELSITGSKDGLGRQLKRDIYGSDLTPRSFVYFQTDKPIYQPSQAFRARTLLFDNAGKAIANEPLTFSIRDPEGTILQKIETVSSRFGVASVEWQIPETSKLGEYEITVKSPGVPIGNEKKFKISRYDLPNFTVSAEADRGFYLPNQKSASVTVRADYLFGKSVTNGKVRVVEETDREWNYKLQKYDTSEGQVREGELSADGTFKTEFDLSAKHDDLDDDDNFDDIHYAAYVTDPTTNRTEQRRFDIRVTKRPIHVYITGPEYNMSMGLPLRAYITTSYADGSPAECDVSVYQKLESDDDEVVKTGKRLVRAKTNRFGAAKVFIPLASIPEDEDELDIVVAAEDSGDRKGLLTKELEFSEAVPAVQISTDKELYRQGDPIDLSILSSRADDVVTVDVIKGMEIVATRRVKLSGGRASLPIPFDERFRHNLTVVAYGTYRSEYGNADTFADSRGIVYPMPRRMSIDAKLDGETFRPGQEATLSLMASVRDSTSPQAVFGVSVIDKAIDERARTDEQFGGRYQSPYSDLEDYLGMSVGFAGLTGAAIDNIDLSRPVPKDVELAIEIGLRRYHSPDVETSGNFQVDHRSAYNAHFTKQFEPIRDSLARRFSEGRVATDPASVKSILATDSIDLDAMRDPWGNPFDVSVSITRDNARIEMTSLGADETANTGDDIEAFYTYSRYFQAIGDKINQAFAAYHRDTGEFIQNFDTLRRETLRTQRLDLDRLRDAWGQKYKFKFEIAGSNFVMKVESGGWDKKFGEYDDFSIWSHHSDYFAVTRANMSAAFRKHVSGTGVFPTDEEQFRTTMRLAGYDLENHKDVFGRRYYVTREALAGRASRRVLGSKTPSITPVVQDIVAYTIRSAGQDGTRGNSDDFELTRFIGLTRDAIAKVVPSSSSSRGAISGIVTDSNGAVIPNASVLARSNYSRHTLSASTDDEGRFVVPDVQNGPYNIEVYANGFQRLLVQNLTVEAQLVTELDVMLDVAGISTEVNVIAGNAIESTVNYSMAQVVTTTATLSSLPLGRTVQGLFTIDGASGSGNRLSLSGVDRDPSVAGSSGPKNDEIMAKGTKERIETPRLREYFPETLLWLPELVSDANGHAQLKIKLADSITTWKVGIVGSNENGDVQIVEKEITAFQPFFVDLDPPKFLTVGDRISLPTQVRNYTAEKQTVDVTMADANWFTLASSGLQSIEVDPNGSKNAVFEFRADTVVKDGKQRVTAAANKDSDAIEKPVTVRPDGREIVRTQSKLFNGSETFNLDFPTTALPNTQTARVKLYPNLFSHVSESVEGLLKRPYGCGEQTISSTYPNLMILKFVKDESTLRNSAGKFLKSGYDRLVGYQIADGGFSYWGGTDKSNLALTAYALRFLNDAREFVIVDENVVRRAEVYLLGQQNAQGGWGDAMMTAYVARSIAMRKATEKDPASERLQKAFVNLAARRAEFSSDSYTLAMIGLASLDTGRNTEARAIAEQLRASAIADNGAQYWDVKSYTPFNGWGQTGRIETTALVVQLLTRVYGPDAASGGTLYLLRNKDRYGVWYSTQTTVNVLDAFLATLASNRAATARDVQVLLNGSVVQTLSVDPAAIVPLTIDLTGNLNPTTNVVEVRDSDGSTLMAQIVDSHYVSWSDAAPDRKSPISLGYRCDKAQAAIMAEIVCTVSAERTNSYGGMMLAEIGLPPGADVSRESLERARKQDWKISRYEILPDRIVFYLAAATTFDFSFKPRYGIDAQTPPSTIYDYYNPEAGATLAPLRFSIR